MVGIPCLSDTQQQFISTREIKIISWTTQAKKLRGSMPPKFEVRDILRKLDQADLDSSTLNKKTDDKMIKVVREDKVKTSNMIKYINILKAREGGGKSRKGWTRTKRSNR